MRDVVACFERAFPHGIRACYLIGSYAEGTAVKLSDIDLIVVMRDSFGDNETQAKAIEVAKRCAANSLIRLDITPRAESAVETMFGVIRVGLKQNSVLMYGDDLRAQMQLPPIETYTQDVIAGALFFIARLHDKERIETLPLEYPDACDEFYGYAQKRFREWYPETVQAGTKELVATVSRIATASIAQRAKKYVGGKAQAIRLYRECIGAPWDLFVEQIYQRCKRDWNYLIPESIAERQELSALCREMLAFENDFCATIPSFQKQ